MLWYWGRRGGGPRYTFEIARELCKRDDIEVHLSLSRQSELFKETDRLGLPALHVDTYSDAKGFLFGLIRLPLLRKRLLTYLKVNQIDVIYTTMDFLWGGIISPSVARSRTGYLLAVHDAERHPGEGGFLRERLLRRDVAAADAIVTMTEAVRQRFLQLHRFDASRVWTAPLGIHLDQTETVPRRLPRDRPVRILFFGRVLPYKGLDILLGAVAILQKEGHQVELEIWGSGNLEPYGEAIAQLESVRVENRWIQEEEFVSIFKRADISALSYREASQSGVIAASMAAGVPVVTTPIAGLVEQIEGGAAGAVAEGFTHGAFADALRSLLSDPTAYRRASESALGLAAGKLSWPRIAEQIGEITHRVAEIGKNRT